MKYGLFCFFFVFQFVIVAQECDKVWLSGAVVDPFSKNSFFNMLVVNVTSNKAVFGQPDGHFAVYVSQNDSIVLSVKGFEKIGFRVKGDSTCQSNRQFELNHIGREIDEVVVKPLKTLQQVKDERAALALRETRTITGLEAFQSPITALYQRFSKTEQSKRLVAQMEFKDSQNKVLQELLKLYVVYDVINLTEEEFEDFIHFMSIDLDFLKTATDMELITFIKDKYEHFQLMK
jgi:hypothetical protein